MATDIAINGRPTGNPLLDSLIGGGRWTDSDGGTTSIAWAAASGAAIGGFSGLPWTANELTMLRSAFGAWQAVANVSFVETAAAAADIQVWSVNQSVLGSTTLADAEFPGSPYYINPLYIRFAWDAQGWATGLQPGGLGYVTMLHEIGHILGLAHPHDGGFDPVGNNFPGVSSSFRDYGDNDLNQGVYTTMGYNQGWETRFPNHNRDNYGLQGTPMALDVAAIQAIYGANTTTNSGDDTYTLPKTNAVGTYWSCIWDTGGNDTISAFGVSEGCRIDLNDATLAGEGAGGYVSSPGSLLGGFTIAHGVTIENAIGGSGSDWLLGNEVANVLTGSGSSDHLEGRDGNDVLFGGSGADDLYGGAGADRFAYVLWNDSLRGARDVIRDFSAAEADVIDLSVIDADLDTPGLQPLTYIGSNEFSAPGQLRFELGLLSARNNALANFEVELPGVSSLSADNLILGGAPGGVSAPTLVSVAPADNATGVGLNANIVLTFSEPVRGTNAGSFVLFRSRDAEFRPDEGNTRTVASAVGSDTRQVTISGNQVVINPADPLLPGKNYYLTIEPGAFTDLAGNPFAGFSDPTYLNFTTSGQAADRTAPTLAASSPMASATAIAAGANINLTFSEDVMAGNTGTITLARSDTRAVLAILSLTDSNVSFAGNSLSIDPPNDLPGGVSIDLMITKGAIIDGSGNAFAGLKRGQLSFTTADLVAPTLTASKPADNAVQVKPDANIVLTFDERVQAGSGSFHVVCTSGGTSYTIDANDTLQVSYAYRKGAGTVTIDPSGPLTAGGDYYVTMDAGAITDLSGNAFAGISSTTDLSFLTLDRMAPTLSAATPSHLLSGVTHATDITLTFSETVRAGTGLIQLIRADTKAVDRAIDVTDSSQVSISGNVATINPSGDLADGVTYQLVIGKGVFKDMSGNPFAGIKKNALNFTIDDTQGPTLASHKPADDATGVSTSANIQLMFNEAVQAGSGTISIVRSDGSTTTISTTDTSQVTFSGKTMIINPLADLTPGSAYHVMVDAGAVRDGTGNVFAGIASSTTLNFSTRGGSAPAALQMADLFSGSGELFSGGAQAATPAPTGAWHDLRSLLPVGEPTDWYA